MFLLSLREHSLSRLIFILLPFSCILSRDIFETAFCCVSHRAQLVHSSYTRRFISNSGHSVAASLSQSDFKTADFKTDRFLRWPWKITARFFILLSFSRHLSRDCRTVPNESPLVYNDFISMSCQILALCPVSAPSSFATTLFQYIPAPSNTLLSATASAAVTPSADPLQIISCYYFF
jgi:hypothetical protein